MYLDEMALMGILLDTTQLDIKKLDEVGIDLLDTTELDIRKLDKVGINRFRT